MNRKKTKRRKPKYLIGLDIVRVFSCIAVVLYHMGVLPGAIPVVCVFFALTGYLTVRSAMSQDRFSLGKYFLNLLLHLYVPLVIVALITVAVVTRFDNIHWLNVRPETTSVLLGYNNIWQILNSQDYFAAHIPSPFVHFWYLSLQLQFAVVFPFVYMLLEALRKRFKNAPVIITGILAVLSLLWFLHMAFTSENLMRVYFGSDTRMFSLIFGVFIGFAERKISLAIPFFRNRRASRLIIAFYLAFMAVSFIVLRDSTDFTIPMVIFTIMTCRCISYAAYAGEGGRTSHYISNLCYAIYLVQFPVIFIISQQFSAAAMAGDAATGALGMFFMYILEVLIIIVLAVILKFGTDFIAKPLPFYGWKVVPMLVAAALVLTSVWGGRIYAVSEDHSEEMQELESQLAVNGAELAERQAAYLESREAAEAEYEAALAALQEDRENVPAAVAELPVVAVGDSVMLGSMYAFYDQFPNAYFDAEVSRPTRALEGILQSLKNQNLINAPVIVNLGGNGDIGNERREEVLSLVEGQEVFWLTNTWLLDVNDDLFEYERTHDHFHVIDWGAYVQGHDDWLAPDGLHLNRNGAPHYVELIYQTLCDFYDAQFDEREAALEREHEAGYMTTMSFFGNDLFAGAGDLITQRFPDAAILYGLDYTWESVLAEVSAQEAAGTLGYNVILGFDAQQPPSAETLQQLVTVLSEHSVYACAVDDASYTTLSQTAGVNVIDLRTSVFGQKEEVLLNDGIHLNELGNTTLVGTLEDTLADLMQEPEALPDEPVIPDGGTENESSPEAETPAAETPAPETEPPAPETEPAPESSPQTETVIVPIRDGVTN